jgi:ABC-type nitrate/sulfonate/bicarbonate transport system ATPase subunit
MIGVNSRSRTSTSRAWATATVRAAIRPSAICKLESRRGEALAIIGRSGCGKSTLLHIIAGLNRPTEGTMHFDDKKVEGPSSRWVMMFQAPHLFPWMKVSQNVGIGLGFAGWPEKEKARAR